MKQVAFIGLGNMGGPMAKTYWQRGGRCPPSICLRLLWMMSRLLALTAPSQQQRPASPAT